MVALKVRQFCSFHGRTTSGVSVMFCSCFSSYTVARSEVTILFCSCFSMFLFRILREGLRAEKAASIIMSLHIEYRLDVRKPLSV